MAKKSKQRFAWLANLVKRTVQVTDNVSDSTLTLTASDLPKEISLEVLLYGIKQKVQDSQSQAAAEDKMAGYKDCWERLLKGDWNAEKVGGGLGIVAAHIEVVAAKRGWKGTSGIAKAQKAWKATSEETRTQLLELWAEDIHAVKEARASGDDVKGLDDMLDKS